MLDPSLVEQRYQVLLESLSLISGQRTRMVRIIEFLEVLLETESREYLVTYGPGLIARMLQLTEETEFTETNLALLDRLAPLLDRIAVEYPDLAINNSFEKIRTRVHMEGNKSRDERIVNIRSAIAR